MTLLLKKYWWVIAIILLISALVQVNRLRLEEKAEKERVSANFENLSKESDRQLNLKDSEWKKLKDQSKITLDSVLGENDLLHQKLRSAQVIKTAYKDTSKTNVTHGQPQQINAPSQSNTSIPVIVVKNYKIPVEVKAYCWGMKGVIYSNDPDSKLNITERTANNSIQRIEISKRFLGFLWPTKKSTFKVFTDCGESTVTNINFVK